MATPAGYTDYLFSAPNLSDIAAALVALRSAGLVGAGDVPDNMLGDPVSIQVAGRADPVTQLPTATTITIRTRQGQDGRWYVGVRTVVPPSAVPFDPTTLGLAPVDAATSRAVLGDWF